MNLPASKIQDEREIIRWFDEGRTYAWMVQEYRRKYDLVVVGSMFGNFRRRRGLDRRITRDDDLIPWAVLEEHRWDYAVAMLRVEARRRAGRPLRDSDHPRLTAWLAGLRERGEVVAYDPEVGFTYVPRRPAIDEDLIREPDRRTTTRPNADR